MKKYKVGDLITLKKGHPCGTNEWKILRTGVDIKLECQGCQREVWLKRTDFERRLRRIKDEEGKWVAIVNYQPKIEE